MTKKALLIAEKPSLMQAIKNTVDKHGFEDDITFKTFAGHTVGLIMPEDYKKEWGRFETKIADLPMIPSTFKYVATDDKKKMFKDLKNECFSGKYDYVINACDAGREGQHIFWSFYETIGSPLPVKRLWSSDTTTASLAKALSSLRDPSEQRLSNMTDASKLRAQFDWLIGMNASRAFSERARAGIAVGRVMTPTLKLCVDRELEIQGFKPQTYYEIEGEFADYTGRYFESETKGRFDSKAKAEAFIKGLSDVGEITEVTQRKVTSRAPELFSLQTLQSEAGKKYGFTMKETLAIVQSLYDDGFMSYPRTDSSYVTKNTAKTFPSLLKTVAAFKKLEAPAKTIMADAANIAKIQVDSKYVNDKKVEDHDAILPTDKVPTRNLTVDEEKIYDLVSRRFLAIFMDALIVEKSRILTKVNDAEFITNGSVLVQKGFATLYGYNPTDQVLPKVVKGDKQAVKGMKLLTGKTTPPKRYTSSSLGDAMAAAGRFSSSKSMKEILKEANGIGTPATRGDVPEKLVARSWIEYKGKANTIHATEAGISLIKALGNHDLVSVDLTAEWENKLRNIERGKLTPADFKNQMENYIHKTIREIETMKLSIVSASSKSGGSTTSTLVGTCPVCGEEVIEGKNVYFCKSYKPKPATDGCPLIISKVVGGKKIPKTDVVKILKGKHTKVMKFTAMSKKTYEASLFWDKKTNKLNREFPSKATKTTTTTKTSTTKTKVNTKEGKGISENKYAWLDPNGFKISKEIWGHNVSKDEAKDLFDGKKLGPFQFTFGVDNAKTASISFEHSKNKIKYHY